MRARGFISKHNITLTVLIAIMLRASVATGWMLQLPADEGFAAPVLTICPQQSPIVAAWLAHGPSPHAHHQHANDGQPADVSLTVTDPACALWAGSVMAAVSGVSRALAVAPGSTTPPTAQKRTLRRPPPSGHRARAPPSPQSV